MTKKSRDALVDLISDLIEDVGALNDRQSAQNREVLAVMRHIMQKLDWVETRCSDLSDAVHTANLQRPQGQRKTRTAP